MHALTHIHTHARTQRKTNSQNTIRPNITKPKWKRIAYIGYNLFVKKGWQESGCLV